MIINICGTNGSGKSTLARRVMACYPDVRPSYVLGRVRPIGYRCARPDGRTLYVPGHYETACGGCDSIMKPTEAYADIAREAAVGDVLFEGIIVQDSVKARLALAAAHRLVVLALRVPIEECLAAIAVRRGARGDMRPLDPTNTVNRVRSIEGGLRRLASAGIEAAWVTREEAWARCAQELGLVERPVAAVAADLFELT